MSEINAKLNVKDENGNVYYLLPQTTMANVEGLNSALSKKVDAVSGKVLSSNDYTTFEKKQACQCRFWGNCSPC